MFFKKLWASLIKAFSQTELDYDEEYFDTHLAGLTGLKRERFFLIRQIDRTSRKIESMYSERIQQGTCPCCVMASWGGTSGLYYQLISKNERRRERLAYINKKLRQK
jgi:hypothetical protein